MTAPHRCPVDSAVSLTRGKDLLRPFFPVFFPPGAGHAMLTRGTRMSIAPPSPRNPVEGGVQRSVEHLRVQPALKIRSKGVGLRAAIRRLP